MSGCRTIAVSPERPISSISLTKLEVVDTTKASDHHLHHVKVLSGSVAPGDSLEARVDADVRQRTRLNHSATHLLHAALRHFAEHGLGAAREARAQAEAAFFAGDRQAYDWWLGITRTLDRRLAAEAARLIPGAAAT